MPLLGIQLRLSVLDYAEEYWSTVYRALAETRNRITELTFLFLSRAQPSLCGDEGNPDDLRKFTPTSNTSLLKKRLERKRKTMKESNASALSRYSANHRNCLEPSHLHPSLLLLPCLPVPALAHAFAQDDVDYLAGPVDSVTAFAAALPSNNSISLFPTITRDHSEPHNLSTTGSHLPLLGFPTRDGGPSEARSQTSFFFISV
ncbi:hypothetical protein C8J56DRAFT_1037923 [Mycena floridula]|nr:hypothetical protein C8J56DRAFT_1037923 [Mycena floridula]